MKWISHRGNLTGPDPSRENHPDQLNYVIEQGYDVEVDVWKIHDTLYLGHDEPLYPVSLEFLNRDSIWCHAKNLDALEYLLNKGVHCFFHENDRFTLTSRGFIWTYPNQNLTEKSISVVLEKDFKNIKCFGVCGDFVEIWKSKNSNLF